MKNNKKNEERIEKLDSILLCAMQSRPGWEYASLLIQAPLSQVGDVDLEHATEEAFPGNPLETSPIELRARLNEICSMMEELDLTPDTDTDKCYIRRWGDDSVSLDTNGDSESWGTAAEAEKQLYEQCSVEDWEGSVYPEFFN